MSSKKKQSEGIALLSVYADDDDEEEMECLDLDESPEQEEDGIQEDGIQDDGGDEENELRRDMMDVERIVSPSNQQLEQSQQPERVNSADRDSGGMETVADDECNNASAENVDPLDRFLRSPLKDKCPELLQRKIKKFIDLKKTRRSFNSEVRNKKDYRNPDFLLHAVNHQGIDQIGSCFSKDVFDPHGYDPSDFYDEIEADMKRERERKEQELKRSPKVEFISGGTQPLAVTGTTMFNVPLPGVSAATAGGLSSMPPTVEAAARDSRQNKKSKWDKVDSDRKHPMPSGSQESSVGAHAALLPAANAGAGYMAFAQQRWREAEERRSSEWKLERRS